MLRAGAPGSIGASAGGADLARGAPAAFRGFDAPAPLPGGFGALGAGGLGDVDVTVMACPGHPWRTLASQVELWGG